MEYGDLMNTIFWETIQLVGGFNHLEKYESQFRRDYPIYYGT